MPRFNYFAKDKTGRAVKGVIEAKDRALALDSLHRKGLVILSLNEEKVKASMSVMGQKVALPELVMFSRQLATMIDSGVPLPQALDILYEQTTKPYFKRVILNIKENVEAGESLSNSLARHPKVFSPLYIYMVRAGEASGALNDILDRLASYLESTNSLITKVRGAMIYPIVVVSIAVLITSGLMIFVVPKFKEMFSSLGGELPAMTRVLIATSEFMQSYWWVGIIIIVLTIVILRQIASTERGKYVLDKFLLSMPVIGELLRRLAVAKFSRTFATLMKSGVPILDAMEIVAKVSGNKVVEQSLLGAKETIKEGQSIATPLEKSKIFPPMVYRMVSVGEQTGELEKMLTKIADFYDEQVNAAIDAMTSMMEPLILVFLGGLIGSIVVSLFLPIFNLSKMIK